MSEIKKDDVITINLRADSEICKAIGEYWITKANKIIDENNKVCEERVRRWKMLYIHTFLFISILGLAFALKQIWGF